MEKSYTQVLLTKELIDEIIDFNKNAIANGKKAFISLEGALHGISYFPGCRSIKECLSNGDIVPENIPTDDNFFEDEFFDLDEVLIPNGGDLVKFIDSYITIKLLTI